MALRYADSVAPITNKICPTIGIYSQKLLSVYFLPLFNKYIHFNGRKMSASGHKCITINMLSIFNIGVDSKYPSLSAWEQAGLGRAAS